MLQDDIKKQVENIVNVTRGEYEELLKRVEYLESNTQPAAPKEDYYGTMNENLLKQLKSLINVTRGEYENLLQRVKRLENNT